MMRSENARAGDRRVRGSRRERRGHSRRSPANPSQQSGRRCAMSGVGRLCCKSLKTPGDKFPARSRNKPRSLIDVAPGSLPKSPVSLSPGDEVPHMFTRKPRLQLEKFAINGAKRLLQHNLPGGDIDSLARCKSFESSANVDRGAGDTATGRASKLSQTASASRTRFVPRRRIHWVSENRCANIETSIRPKRDDFLWQ
jgi:hypothetical protein